MILTVIVPDNRPGMQRMLEQELQGIESEIIYEKWLPGLKQAKGDFVCLLEYDSAVKRGSIARLLQPFLDNPRYRKLAMVSPMIEFADCEAMSLPFLSDDYAYHSRPYLARAGCVSGAIIRRNSINKILNVLERPETILVNDYDFSVALWENGLRIMHDKNSVYESPYNYEPQTKAINISDMVLELWKRECVL